jgi:hypothetical protein
MLASGITRQAIEEAAASIGVRADVSTINAKGTRHRVKLYPIVPPEAYRVVRSKGCPARTCLAGEPCYHAPRMRRHSDSRGDAPYQRESVGYGNAGRRVHAVCWHGFRDFFRACFERFPDAVFRTSLDVWRGSADFEARFRDSGHRNVGPRIAPVSIVDACRCPDVGCAA